MIRHNRAVAIPLGAAGRNSGVLQYPSADPGSEYLIILMVRQI